MFDHERMFDRVWLQNLSRLISFECPLKESKFQEVKSKNLKSQHRRINLTRLLFLFTTIWNSVWE